MTRVLSLLVASAVAGAGARAAATSAEHRSPRNVVRRVEVTTEPGAVLVTIVLRSPPTFTTRSLGSRHEFVVDLPEARFERPASPKPVAKGALARVESTVVVREGVPTARVTLVLARESDPPLVSADGSTLRIRIPGTDSAPLVATVPPPPPGPALIAPTPPIAGPAVPQEPAAPAAAQDAVASVDPLPPVAAEPEPPPAAPAGPSITAPPGPTALARAPERAAPRARPEPRRVVREVAFRPLPASSAVLVRLSAPPRFEVVDEAERRVTVELPETSLERRNDARPLDTSYFPGPVARIVTRRAGARTWIDIDLKRKAVHRERVDGDTLVIEFDHPVDP